MIQFPINKEFYEFYGIMLGDGCISRYINQNREKFEFRIDGNSTTDLDYYKKFVQPLTSQIRNKNTKISFRKDCNGIFIRFHSKEFAQFLNKKFNFPIGKKGDIKLATFLEKDWKSLKYILRGIFDTDGCLYFTKNNSTMRSYPIIEISSHSKPLLHQLNNILLSKGFAPKFSHYNDSIKLHGKKALKRWIDLIGTNNPDKFSKFKFWQKFGYCPKINELNYQDRVKKLGP